ncbi:MAG: hypothetical protein GON13_01525 [Nanoarchaeota archaeon]|nr:hypothetical protein [Nanoarchaeota archaeon]
MGTYSMLNKITELNDELLDLKHDILKNHQETLNNQTKNFKKLDKIYANKTELNEFERYAEKSDKKVEHVIKQLDKTISNAKKLKENVEKLLKEQETTFKKLMNEASQAEIKRKKTFKQETVKHFKKLDEKIQKFNIDNTDFEKEMQLTQKKNEEITKESIKKIRKINREFGSDIVRKIGNIDAFTVEKLSEFYKAYQTYEKAMQQQVLQADEHLQKRFAQEKMIIDEKLQRIVQVVNQFYEMYYQKVSKDELRVYQRTIDELEKRIEQLEKGVYARE